MRNPELLREIIEETYRTIHKDEQTLGIYKTSINSMKHRTDISQKKVDLVLSFIYGRCEKIIELIDLYLKDR